MLTRLKNVFCTNFALAKLGVDTQKLNSKWRLGCLEMGLKEGLNPKEIALTMLFQMPPEHVNLALANEVIHRWTVEGKVRSLVVSDARIAGILSIVRQTP
jgi:hypothetical protein